MAEGIIFRKLEVRIILLTSTSILYLLQQTRNVQTRKLTLMIALNDIT